MGQTTCTSDNNHTKKFDCSTLYGRVQIPLPLAPLPPPPPPTTTKRRRKNKNDLMED